MIQTLSKTQMLNAKGGVSAREYCKTLVSIVMRNPLSESAMAAARMSYAKYC